MREVSCQLVAPPAARLPPVVPVVSVAAPPVARCRCGPWIPVGLTITVVGAASAGGTVEELAAAAPPVATVLFDGVLSAGCISTTQLARAIEATLTAISLFFTANLKGSIKPRVHRQVNSKQRAGGGSGSAGEFVINFLVFLSALRQRLTDGVRRQEA